MDLPVWILTGDADDVAPPATNAQVAAAHIPGARLTLLPGAGHYAFLATCTDAGVAAIPVCRLAGAQEAAHRTAIAQARELFGRYLAN
jgi:pimeloyl-ACP methyl ester carboxylesterase